jgi:single-strand DNA-binding protein
MATRGLNKVMLIGNLGKDAETRFTPSGVAVTNFSVATPRRSKDPQTGDWKEETDWHNVVLWRAENLANYLQKGKRVYVEGRLQTRSWEDQSGTKRYMTEVVAEPFGGQSDDAGPPARRAAAGAQGGAPPPAEDDQGITDDDVPF